MPTSPILVSACLLGQPVRYDGQASPCAHPWLQAMQAAGRVRALCPEMAGGLPTPRPSAELCGGDGRAVWQGAARVLTAAGEDLTAPFVVGAQAALAEVRAHGVRLAVLKARSPSCGSQQVHDGQFAGQLTAGEGVTATLLRAYGVTVFDESQLDAAAAWLAREAGHAPR